MTFSDAISQVEGTHDSFDESVAQTQSDTGGVPTAQTKLEAAAALSPALGEMITTAAGV